MKDNKPIPTPRLKKPNRKMSVVLDYNGQRILLDTIAGYAAMYKDKRGEITEYGIEFSLRTGEIIEQYGNDQISRNKVLEYLDDYFKPDKFTANRCQVCEHKEDKRNGNCYSKHDCTTYKGLLGFKREKEAG